MTIDLQGTALVIGAICTGIAAIAGPIVNAYLLLKQSRQAEVNKQEAIAARAAQTTKIDHVTHLVNDRSEKQDKKIDSLKTELLRSAVPGATPTTDEVRAELNSPLDTETPPAIDDDPDAREVS